MNNLFVMRDESAEIAEARQYFETEAFYGNYPAWFQRVGLPSIHREQVYGYEPTYSLD